MLLDPESLHTHTHVYGDEWRRRRPCSTIRDWLAPPRTVRVGFDDGSFVLRSPEPLQPYARCIGEWLERWAAETPEAPAFAERAPDGGWRRLSWAQARAQVGRIAQGLLDLKLAPQAPIVVLSDNALDHLLLMLAGMHIGRAGVHRVQRLLPADPGLHQDPRHPEHAGPGAGLRRRTPRSTGRRWPAPGCDAPAGVQPRRRAASRRAGLRRAWHARPRGPAVMRGLRGHHARHACQVPADLGLHRPPQGGDQHPPHAVRQPADDRAGLALPRAREAGAGRLAAVEPHLRRQPQPATWCCATAARWSSTKAGRRRA